MRRAGKRCKICCMLLIAMLTVGILSVASGRNTAEAAETAKGVLYEVSNTVEGATVSNNISDNNYTVYGARLYSYFVENEDGSFTRVEYISGTGVVVEVYSADYEVVSTITLTEDLEEMTRFGGFYAGESYNFLVYGESNTEESSSCEVLRIVKYDKDWTRLDQKSIYGANTYSPFAYGSLRMTEANGELYIYSCHTMYTTVDGVNHQANMTFVIDEEEMTITHSYYGIFNFSVGYVSHSFNQFILVDDGYVYRVDHGDGYPRAVSITKTVAGGSLTSLTASTYALEIQGTVGNNATGVSVGGFEASADNLLIVGNSVDQSDSSTYSAGGQRNIFLTVTDKSLGSTELIWLTDYASGDGVTPRTPQMVKISDDSFLLMWEEYVSSTGTVETKAVTVDGAGNLTSDIMTIDVRLSDCQPILTSDGLVTWYVTDGSDTVVYVLDPNNLFTALDVTLSLENADEGNVLSWPFSNGVASYQVYRKTGDGEYVYLAETTDTSWVDTDRVSGTLYTYKVVAVSSDGQMVESGEEEIFWLAAPEIQGVENVSSGVQITWSTVDGADGYYIYYKKSTATSWSKVSVADDGSDTMSTVRTSLTSGTTYQFYVIAYSGTENASGLASEQASIYYLKAPTVTLTAEEADILVSWGTVSGAVEYAIYRSTDGGDYVLLTTTEDLSYTDADVTETVAYAYVVYALSGDDSSAASTEKTLVFLKAPTITEVVNESSGITVTWTQVDGASSYYVYYKITTASKYSYKTVSTGDDSTLSYTISATTGYTYSIYVVAYSSTASSRSAASNTVEFLRIAKPTVTLTTENAGIAVTWKAVSGAEGYYVYRSADGGDYSLICTTEDLAYTDTEVESGVTYSYKVLGYAEDTLGAESTAVSRTFLSVPQITRVGSASGKVTIHVATVTGATRYYLYYKVSSDESYSSKYVTAQDGDTQSMYFSATVGETYDFYVVAWCSSTSQSVASDVWEYTCVDIPTLTVEVGAASLVLDWTEIEDATGYEIWRSSGSEDAALLATVTSLSYTDTAVESGTTYAYQIFAVITDTTGAWSATVSQLYLASPVITDVSNSSSGITLTWNTVDGASYYYIYYKTEDAETYTYKSVTAGNGSTQSYTISTVTGSVYEIYMMAYKSKVYSAASNTAEYLCLKSTTVTLTAETEDILVSWTAMTSAEGYYVYRSVDDGEYELVATTTETTYTDTDVVSGKTYTYQVYAYAGTIIGAASTAKSLMFLDAPTMTGASAQSGSLTVTWEAVEEATYYKVYYKRTTSSGYYSSQTVEVEEGIDLSCTISSSTNGVSYYVYVVAYSDDGHSAKSETETYVYLTAPTVTLSHTEYGVSVSWTTNRYAEGYYVYRMAAGDSSYTLVCTAEDTSWEDTDVEAGVEYTYQVCAYSGSSIGVLSTEKSISKTSLADCTVALAETTVVYDGTEQEPAVTVTFGSETLSSGEYTVSYANNVNAGTATVTVTGLYAYAGTASLTFTIEKASQSVTAALDSSSVQIGDTVAITASGQGTISYASADESIATVDADGVVTGVSYGQTTITVTASGNENYKSASATLAISVTRIPISGASIAVNDGSFVYDGTAKTPSVTVTCGGKTLTEGTDYTVTYADNVNAGTATITVTGIGSYTGTATAAFTIEKAAQVITVGSGSSVSVRIGNTVSLGATAQGTISYVSGDTAIATVSSDGVVTGVAAGTVTITLSAAETTNYKAATATVTITVTRIPLSECTLELEVESYTYDGTAKTPEVTVTCGSTVLGSSDYMVAYANNINAGTATVTVTGIGSYEGTLTATFVIGKASQTITATVDSAAIAIDSSTQITVEAIGTVTYTSSDETIATVDANGLVTGVSDGTVTITISASGNDCYEAAETTIEITVKKANVAYLEDTDIYVIRTDSENGNIDASTVEELAAGRSTEQLIFSKTTSFDRTLELVLEEIAETLGVTVEGDKALLLQADDSGNLLLVDQAMIADNTVTFSVSSGADGVVVYGYNGDVTGDGKIDAKDTLAILRGVSGRTALDEVEKGFADVNLDGMINSNDLLAVVKYVSGRTSTLNERK